MEKRVYQSLRELPLMLSMMDVASVLGISKAGAYTLAHSRDFPAFRVGRRIVISQEKFLDWLESRLRKVLSLRTSYFAVFVIFV